MIKKTLQTNSKCGCSCEKKSAFHVALKHIFLWLVLIQSLSLFCSMNNKAVLLSIHKIVLHTKRLFVIGFA